MGGLVSRLKSRARELKREVVALWIAAGDSRTPVAAKAVASVVAAYALSPIDIIPDFIPVLGYLDDLILLPMGIMLAVKLIPQHLMAEFRLEAARRSESPVSAAGATAVVVVWITAAAALLWLFWPTSVGGG